MKKGYAPPCAREGELVVWGDGRYWLWRVHRYRGFVLLAAVTPPAGVGRDYLEEDYQRSSRMKRDDIESQGSGPAQPSANGKALEMLHPTLARYLLDVQWDCGAKRTPCKLHIAAERGLWAITLEDRNYARILRVTVDTWTEMLPALEAALRTKPVPWTAAEWLERFLPKPKGKKKS